MNLEPHEFCKSVRDLLGVDSGWDYPTLLPIAKTKKTLSAAYLKDESAEKKKE